MDSDLVGPPRLEAHVQEGMPRQELPDLEVRDRLTGSVAVERPARRLLAVAADRRVDLPAPRTRATPDERDVPPFELTAPDEVLQPPVSLLRAGDHEEARRVA